MQDEIRHCYVHMLAASQETNMVDLFIDIARKSIHVERILNIMNIDKECCQFLCWIQLTKTHSAYHMPEKRTYDVSLCMFLVLLKLHQPHLEGDPAFLLLVSLLL